MATDKVWLESIPGEVCPVLSPRCPEAAPRFLRRAFERQECFAWEWVESVANMTAVISPVASLWEVHP